MLARRIDLPGAITIGLGAMIGAGIFSSVAPAAAVAGPWLFASLLLAAFVAFLNAKSVARLAALHPESGGAYTYGRLRLHRAAGVAAGLAFIGGKSASAAAMALTFAAYVAPDDRAKPAALSAIALMAAINYAGIKKTIGVTTAILAVVFLALGIAVFAALAGDGVRFDRLSFSTADLPDTSDLMRGAALLFFAFAGYARIATLGEEVIEPERTIPRAIAVSFLVALTVYTVVMFAAVVALDPARLKASSAPLAEAAASFPRLAMIVRGGAAIASLGVLLSLIAGISRTMYAMGKNGDAPRFLAAIHPRHDVPHRAVLTSTALASIVVFFGDVVQSIALSSFCVLLYYAVANASALRLPHALRGSIVFPLLGLFGCVAIALSLLR
jgi:APA family basic amino acid/polyamine antiporter